MRAAEQKDIVLRLTKRSAFQMLGNIGPAHSISNDELSALSPSRAGGIEPPNGGIKISLIIQRFQDAFGKMVKTPSSNSNNLAAVSK